jgi:hypothetical protein
MKAEEVPEVNMLPAPWVSRERAKERGHLTIWAV